MHCFSVDHDARRMAHDAWRVMLLLVSTSQRMWKLLATKHWQTCKCASPMIACVLGVGTRMQSINGRVLACLGLSPPNTGSVGWGVVRLDKEIKQADNRRRLSCARLRLHLCAPTPNCRQLDYLDLYLVHWPQNFQKGNNNKIA